GGSALRERRNGLALADRRRAQREARHARRAPGRRAGGGGAARVADNTMFFPRLRNQAKWAFVVLIVVFAGGFVFLGVGSGGLDLGQLLRDAFGNKGSSTGSLSKAEQAVRERRLNAPARRTLRHILQNKGPTAAPIATRHTYGKLRPN